MSVRERTTIAAFKHYFKDPQHLKDSVADAKRLYVEPARQVTRGERVYHDRRRADRIDLALDHLSEGGALEVVRRFAPAFSNVRTSRDVPDMLPAIVHTWAGKLVDVLFGDVEAVQARLDAAIEGVIGGYHLTRAFSYWREGECLWAFWQLEKACEQHEAVRPFLDLAHALKCLDESAKDRLRVYALHGEPAPKTADQARKEPEAVSE